MSDAPAALLAGRFVKTDAGRAEVQRRTLPLSRAARNLLLIIDASRSGEGWVVMVHGATVADLQALLQAGLVAAGAAPTATRPATAPPAPTPAKATAGSASPAPAPARMSLAQALETKGYSTLYDRITAEARPRLGLIKGYKLILDVERCSGPDEIRALAQRFVEQVRQTGGDSAALALAQVLLAPG